MKLLDRVARLATTDLDRLVARTDDPVGSVGGLVAEIESVTVDLRRETVAAIVRVQWLEAAVDSATARASAREQAAIDALEAGDEPSARERLAEKLRQMEIRRLRLAQLEAARQQESQLKDDILALGAKVDEARRRRVQLRRRPRVTSPPPSRRPVPSQAPSETPLDLDAYARRIPTLPNASVSQGAVEAELERLRAQRALMH